MTHVSLQIRFSSLLFYHRRLLPSLTLTHSFCLDVAIHHFFVLLLPKLDCFYWKTANLSTSPMLVNITFTLLVLICPFFSQLAGQSCYWDLDYLIWTDLTNEFKGVFILQQQSDSLLKLMGGKIEVKQHKPAYNNMKQWGRSLELQSRAEIRGTHTFTLTNERSG